MNLLRRIFNYILSLVSEWFIRLKWIAYRSNDKWHHLPGPLLISLTSYPPRFKTLDLTLKCLLMQSMKCNKIVLWIAHEDREILPESVLRLQKYGIELRYCENIRSYKKIIPTLLQHPDAFVVTADDDLYYWNTWLEELVDSCNPSDHAVVCHRAHYITLHRDKQPLPYRKWNSETNERDASTRIFPTSGGGALYPPGIFYEDMFRTDLFMALCPTADDIWLYWMALLGGATFKKVGPVRRLISWNSSQKSALSMVNYEGTGNDLQMSKMIERYSFPGN